MNIRDMTALITGSSGRLGSRIAEALGAAGCRCVCHYHQSGQAAEEAAGRIRAAGSDAMTVRADLADEDEICAMFEQAAKLGPVRILVNSAAVFHKTPLAELTAEAVYKDLGTNLVSVMLTCKYFAAALGADDEGAIVNLADVGGIRPWAEYSAYCASKAGVISVTKTLAKELAPRVRVNAVAPGIVIWPGEMDPAQEQKQLAMIPMKRFGDANDVTSAIMYLLSADYVTGQTLCVDGGRSI